MFRGELEEWRATLSETFQIEHFVVRRARLPARPDYPDPFESEGADGRVMLLAFGDLH